MPRRDGTGPQGMGPMTGRKMGNCNRKARRQSPETNIDPSNSNFGDGIRGFFRRGFGNNKKGTGSGRGNRNR